MKEETQKKKTDNTPSGVKEVAKLIGAFFVGAGLGWWFFD